MHGRTAQEWQDRFFADVRAVCAAAMEQIRQDPWLCAARFAGLNAACCCGKALDDEHSVAYDIGPECRRGMPAERLRLLCELTARARAEQAAPHIASTAGTLPFGDADLDPRRSA